MAGKLMLFSMSLIIHYYSILVSPQDNSGLKSSSLPSH